VLEAFAGWLGWVGLHVGMIAALNLLLGWTEEEYRRHRAYAEGTGFLLGFFVAVAVVLIEVLG
jgi:hypothetical protein